MQRFRDRKDAGKKLTEKLLAYKDDKDTVVLALPRGGIPVAYEVARALHLPLDLLIVRKLGTPGHRELAMGAIATGGVKVLNEGIIASLRIPQTMIDKVVETELKELERREFAYRGAKAPLDVKDKTVILMDDGIATGATMRAAIASLKQRHPKKIVLAVPTAAGTTYTELSAQVDEFVCLATPEPYIAVGVWYDSFPQTSDDEVKVLLQKADQELAKTSFREA